MSFTIKSLPTEAAPEPSAVPISAPVPIPVPIQVVAEPSITPQQAELYARKERALLGRAKQLKQQEADIQGREAGMISRDRIIKEPLKVMAELGIKPHQLAESLLNAPQPLSKAEVEMEALKAEIEALKASRAADAEGSVEQALSQIRSEATKLVKSDPRFETIQATGQAEEVVKLIKGIFDESGEILSVEEAANLVETQLAEDEFKRFERLSKLSKVQKRLKPQTPAQGSEAQAAETQAASEQKQVPYRSKTSMPAKVSLRNQMAVKQVRTLTNSLTSSTRSLSARDRAILAFSNKLTD